MHVLGSVLVFFCLFGFGSGIAEQESTTCDNILDLIIILDSSGSIAVADFSKAIDAMKTLVQLLKIGPKKVMVTVINYSTDIQVPITFADMKVTNFSIQWLVNKIGMIQHMRGGTNTHIALMEAKEICDDTCRPFEDGVARSVVVFTDGRSNIPAETIKEAANLRSATHANIFAVGIGGYYRPELQAIASDPAYIFTMENYQQLTVLINEITNKTCQMPAFVQPNVKVDTEVPANTYRYYRLDINQLRRSEGGFFELTINPRVGSVRVFTSSSNTNPQVGSSREGQVRSRGWQQYYLEYIESGTPRYYFSVLGVGATNEFDFIPRILDINGDPIE